MTDKSSTRATLAAAQAFTRRKILKSTVIAGTAASIGPFVLPRRALGAARCGCSPGATALEHDLGGASALHHWSVTAHRQTKSTASSTTCTVPFDWKTDDNYANKEDPR